MTIFCVDNRVFKQSVIIVQPDDGNSLRI